LVGIEAPQSNDCDHYGLLKVHPVSTPNSDPNDIAARLDADEVHLRLVQGINGTFGRSLFPALVPA
jgi:hypothetical protein